MEQPIKDKLERLSQSGRKPALALLELIKDLAGTSPEGQAGSKAVEAEFINFFSAAELQQGLQELQEESLIAPKNSGYAPAADPSLLDQTLSDLAGSQKIPLLPGYTVRELWSGFTGYLVQNEPDLSVTEKPQHNSGRLEAEVSYRNRKHIFKAKFFPFPLPPWEGTLDLFFGSWSDQDFSRLSSLIADKGWLQQAAFYNLAAGVKINIVPGSIFPYFDWYLRENFNLRIAPCPVFARELMNKGRLRFEG